jgi:site-specific recombinase XerD
MKQDSMKVLFFIRKSKLLKNGEAPIFLRVTVSGQQDEIRIQRSIPVRLWNNQKGCSKGKDRVSMELNSYIESLTVRLYQIHKELVCQEAWVTPKHLLIKLGRRTVLSTMKRYMDDWTALIGKEYQKSTLSRYGNCYESLKIAINEFYKKEDIAFNELNGEFIDAFEMHLRIVRKLSQNTLTKYVSCFRKIIGIARDNGWLTFDPLAGKRKRLFRKEETCPTFLTLDELQRIISKDFSTTRLEHVKDFFLFCCLTGMSYIDVSTLLPVHLCRDNKGQLWIHKSRVKITTAKEICTSNVPLLAPAVAILEKYKGWDPNNPDGPCLPVPSNQKMNEYLKEIAVLCRINKRLTVHVARHTFGTTITLAINVALQNVSKMLGHSSTRMTQHYARVLDHNIMEDMQGVAKLIFK